MIGLTFLILMLSILFVGQYIVVFMILRDGDFENKRTFFLSLIPFTFFPALLVWVIFMLIRPYINFEYYSDALYKIKEQYKKLK